MRRAHDGVGVGIAGVHRKLDQVDAGLEHALALPPVLRQRSERGGVNERGAGNQLGLVQNRDHHAQERGLSEAGAELVRADRDDIVADADLALVRASPKWALGDVVDVERGRSRRRRDGDALRRPVDVEDGREPAAADLVKDHPRVADEMRAARVEGCQVEHGSRHVARIPDAPAVVDLLHLEAAADGEAHVGRRKSRIVVRAEG